MTAKPTCGWFKTFPKNLFDSYCCPFLFCSVTCPCGLLAFFIRLLPQGKPCWWLFPHRAVKKRHFQFKLRELKHRRGTVRTWVSFLRDQTPSRPRSIFINFLCFSFFLGRAKCTVSCQSLCTETNTKVTRNILITKTRQAHQTQITEYKMWPT